MSSPHTSYYDPLLPQSAATPHPPKQTLTKRLSAWRLGGGSANAGSGDKRQHQTNGGKDSQSLRRNDPRTSSIQLTLVEFIEGNNHYIAHTTTNDVHSLETKDLERSHEPRRDAAWRPLHVDPPVKRVLRRVSTWFHGGRTARKRDHRRTAVACSVLVDDHDQARNRPPERAVSHVERKRRDCESRRCQSEDGGRGAPSFDVRRTETVRNGRERDGQKDHESVAGSGSEMQRRTMRRKTIRRSPSTNDEPTTTTRHSTFLHSQPVVPAVPVHYSQLRVDSTARRAASPVEPDVALVSPLPPNPPPKSVTATVPPVMPEMKRNLSHQYVWEAKRDGWMLVTRDKKGVVIGEVFVGKYAI
ncbi:hypothetical protein HKX48_005914 [Thoreauomyces humboldtii]|nr:hypothetical protein HKX48_005914 [Thoreauomyces humboldtii]